MKLRRESQNDNAFYARPELLDGLIDSRSFEDVVGTLERTAMCSVRNEKLQPASTQRIVRPRHDPSAIADEIMNLPVVLTQSVDAVEIQSRGHEHAAVAFRAGWHGDGPGLQHAEVAMWKS